MNPALAYGRTQDLYNLTTSAADTFHIEHLNADFYIKKSRCAIHFHNNIGFLEVPIRKAALRKKYEKLSFFNRKDKASHIWTYAADEINLGRGGKTMVFNITGVSRVTLDKGIKELEESSSHSEDTDVDTVKKESGGRKRQQKLKKDWLKQWKK